MNFIECCCEPPCDWTITVYEAGCDGTRPTGPSVNVTGPGGYNVTLTPSVAYPYVATFHVTVAGTYTIHGTGNGYTQTTTVVVGPDCINRVIKFCFSVSGADPRYSRTVCGRVVTGCKDLTATQPFFNVVARVGGSVVGSATTDAQGRFCICCTPTTAGDIVYGVEVPPARFGTVFKTSPTSVHPPCSTHGTTEFSPSFPYSATWLFIPAASGFAYLPCTCVSGGHPCSIPVASTLLFTDPIGSGGAVSLSCIFGDGTINPGIWYGTGTVDYPGCYGCAATPGLGVTYQFGGFGNGGTALGCGMEMSYPVRAPLIHCPGPSSIPGYNPVGYSAGVAVPGVYTGAPGWQGEVTCPTGFAAVMELSGDLYKCTSAVGLLTE